MNATVETREQIDRLALRRWVSVATVLACLPYLLLKVAWLSGWTVGVAHAEFAGTTRVANLLTAGLEVVAIAVAVAFVVPIGRRVPAVALVVPAWVATGLLTPVALGALLGAPIQAVTGGGNAFTGDEVLAGWVFAVAYGGFALQAVLLLTGFALHARERWPVATGGGRHDGAGTTRPLQNLLGGAFVAAATVFTVQQLSWAVQGGGAFSHPDTAQRVFLLAGALAAAAGAAATVRLLRGGRLTRPRLALAWVGTAVTFTASLTDTLKTVVLQPGDWGATAAGPGDATLTLFVLLGALAGAIGGALRLVEEERDDARSGSA